VNQNIHELRHALAQARSHLRRCEEELDRWEEPAGGDRRGTLHRLKTDVVRASNDVEVLSSALWAAEHAAEAFECCAPGG
jgi:hypothetical protein